MVSLVAALHSVRVQADVLEITLADLDNALQSADAETDLLQRQILRTLQSALDARSIGFSDGQLLYTDSEQNIEVDGGCNTTVINSISTEIAVQGDSAVRLTLDSLYEPVELSIDLDGRLISSGRARQTVAIDIGGCQPIGRDTLSFNAEGPVALQMTLRFSLNPVWVEPTVLRLLPELELDGVALTTDIRVDVNDSLLAGIVERILLARIDDELGPSAVERRFEELESGLQQKITEAWPDGYVDVQLPEPGDAQINALYQLLSSQARFPLLLGYIEDNRAELMAALLLGDNDRISLMLENAALCQATDVLTVNNNAHPLYKIENGMCRATLQHLPSVEGSIIPDDQLYSDAACIDPIAFVPESQEQWCANVLSEERFGNGELLGETRDAWSLSPATRFDIGALTLEGKHQPYVNRTVYKTVTTAGGQCSLEMRVYAAQPVTSSTSLLPAGKPMLALHGGSWQYRGTGMLGLEATVTHFTEAGFVVFAPFYRLIGDNDGNAACRNADFDAVIEDSVDAFDWVRDNAVRYGASGKPVVFGQSAGGHLAARLAVTRPADVDRAVLFYAPVDFEDFLSQLRLDPTANRQGVRILEAIAGMPISELDPMSRLVQENTFPSTVLSDPQRYPGFYMMHGERDTLLPYRQSSRLCNALSGDVDGGPAPLASLDDPLMPGEIATGMVRSFQCGDPVNELHLFAEADHTLDLCVAEGVCPAGSAASAEQVALKVQRAVQWASGPLPDNTATGTPNDESDGAGNTDPDNQLLLSDVDAESGSGSDAHADAGVASSGGSGSAGLRILLLLVLFNLFGAAGVPGNPGRWGRR